MRMAPSVEWCRRLDPARKCRPSFEYAWPNVHRQGWGHSVGSGPDGLRRGVAPHLRPRRLAGVLADLARRDVGAQPQQLALGPGLVVARSLAHHTQLVLDLAEDLFLDLAGVRERRHAVVPTAVP